MKQGFILLMFSLILGFSGTAQNHNVWFFGDGNFLDFNNVPPTISGNGVQIATPTSTYCLEGSSVICDAAGQLLFYTDGRTVWDRNYNQMPNGTGLNGHLSGAQVLAIPQPGTTDKYLVFHTDYAGNANGLSYSEVDMSLNGGFGDVTFKNTQLHTPSSEHLKAITHCNGTDIWVLSHSATGNTFYAYLVTNAGVAAPVISNVGNGLGTIFEGMNYLACSKDGSRVAIPSTASFDILDFDNQNGTLCNPVNVPVAGFGIEPYGLEFSPDGTKIYASQFDLWQYNITSNVGAMPELIVDKCNGLLVEPNNASELGRAFASLARCETTRNEMGQRNHAIAKSEYSWSSKVDAYLAAYGQLVS